MHPWSEAFAKHVETLGFEQAAVAKELKVSPSVVHYWLRGSIPREPLRARVEKWSKGKVKASLGAKKAA